MPQANRPWLRLALVLAAAGTPNSSTLAAPPTNCWIETEVIDLGDYDPSVPPSPVDGSLTLGCSNQGARVEVGLSAGLHGTFTERQMANGADRLGYNIYLPDGAVWGDGDAYPSLAEAKRTYPASLPIRLQIRAGQWVPAGTYTDTITVTLIF